MNGKSFYWAKTCCYHLLNEVPLRPENIFKNVNKNHATFALKIFHKLNQKNKIQMLENHKNILKQQINSIH
jgi:hypothetical protein